MADEATNLTMLGNTGTVVEGQSYRLFTFSKGKARWYPSQRILELDNVEITNTGTESFINYAGTSQINIQLIGTNKFRYDKSKKAKAAISSNGYLVIESKDVRNRGSLTITTYGHTASGSSEPAAITMSGYSTNRATLNVRHCALNVFRQGTGWGTSINYDYCVFTSTGTYEGVFNVHDGELNLETYGKPILGKAKMTLTDKDCIYNSDVTLSSATGKPVADDGSMVTELQIGYPLIFGTYDSYSGKYIMTRTGAYSTQEDYGTDNVVVYDETNHKLSLNGGVATGDIVYYGHNDLTVEVMGNKLTTLNSASENGIETVNGSLIIRGDHIADYQGLKMIGKGYGTGIKIPTGKTLIFEHNAKVEIEDFSIGLSGHKPEGAYSGPGDPVETPNGLSTLKVNKSTLKINCEDLAFYGFEHYSLEDCSSNNNDYVTIGYMRDQSAVDDEGNVYDYLFYYYAFALCDAGGDVVKSYEVHRNDIFRLWVGGRQVTLENLYDINFKTDDNEVSGVCFDDDSNTLILDNAFIRTTGQGDIGYGIYYFEYNKPLTIKVIGDCHIVSENYVGIYSAYSLMNIYGGIYENTMPTLYIDSKLEGISLNNQTSLLVSQCDLDVHAKNGSAFSGFYNPSELSSTPQPAVLSMSLSNVRLSSENVPSTQYMKALYLEDLEILTPHGSVFSQEKGGVSFNNELVVGDVIIGKNIEFQDEDVEAICVANWDINGDGGINRFEAEAITSLNGKFKDKTSVDYFNELVYFTGLEEIEEEAFNGCSNLKEVTIPKNVKTLNSSCFYQCGFESVSIPSNVVSIGDYSFYGCSNLWDVSYAERTLKVIGNYAFAGSGIYPNIPQGVERIGDYAFKDCFGEMIGLPSSVKYVGEGALTGFMGVDIPEDSQLEEVKAQAFYGYYYYSLTLPSTLGKIDDEAFSNGDDSYMTEIFVRRSSPATVGNRVFGVLQEGSLIHVPNGSVEAYKTAWPEYAEFIVGYDLPIATSVSTPVVEKVRDGVYNMKGQLIRHNHSVEGLPAGIYIVNGKKVLVK